MRTIALVLVAAACSGGQKSTKSPEPAPAPARAPEPRVVKSPLPRPENAAPRAEAKAEEPPPAPAAPPAPPPGAYAILDRTHDKAGEIPGMPGWSLKRVDDRTYCGATKIVVMKRKAKLNPDQAALAKVYALTFPTDLNFDPNNKKASEASLKKFNDFIEKLKTTGAEANKYYEAQLAGTDPAVKASAAARMAQVSLQLSSVIARAPIPKDVRSGEFSSEKVDAYCDRMEEVAVPLAMRGQEALAACGKAGLPAGWYTDYCATGATASAPSP